MAARLRPALLLGVTLLSACDSEPEAYQFSGATMGTRYNVTLPRLPDGHSESQLQQAFEDYLARINMEMSTYQPESTISRFNRAGAGEWFEVSSDFVEVTQAALKLGELSDGRYDVTIAPLVNLWGFGSEGYSGDRVPADEEIATARAKTGQRRLELKDTPPAIRKQTAGIALDLSSIAKGYGVDVLAEYLESVGTVDYLVDIGGDLRANGRSQRGDIWRIAIEKPVSGQRSVQRVVEITDFSIATSGDYRNYFEKNGVRYSHIIDAQTGKPVTHALASVTVLAENAMLADGWATVLLVLGEEAGYELASREDIAAFFIYAQAEGFATRETAKFTRLTNGQ